MLTHYKGDAEIFTLQKAGEEPLQVKFTCESGGVAHLSTAHKCTQRGGAGEPREVPPAPAPFVEWRENASVLKVSKAEPQTRKGGGVRGVVKGFSRGSRKRLMQCIASVRRDASLPVFITLTYPNLFPQPKQSKTHLKAFLMRVRRAYPEAGIIWKLEPQRRGAPHFHLLVWGVGVKELRGFVPTAWFEIAGGGDELHLLWHEGKLKNRHCTQKVNSFNGVWAYASKYLGKTFEVAGWDSKAVGRFWAVVARENIPFGEYRQSNITRGKAVQVMRYQRRYAKLKGRNYPSLTTFCNAKQWVEKLNIKPNGGDEL